MHTGSRDEATPASSVFGPVLRRRAPSLVLISRLTSCYGGTGKAVINGKALCARAMDFLRALARSITTIPGYMLVTALPTDTARITSSRVKRRVLSSLRGHVMHINANVGPMSSRRVFRIIHHHLFRGINGPRIVRRMLAQCGGACRGEHSSLPIRTSHASCVGGVHGTCPFRPRLVSVFHLG